MSRESKATVFVALRIQIAASGAKTYPRVSVNAVRPKRDTASVSSNTE